MQTLSASPCLRPVEMERMEKKKSELEERREKEEKITKSKTKAEGNQEG